MRFERLINVKKKKSLSPFIMILLSFFIVIVVGTILLLLPFSSKGKNLTFIEALFTTTSAVCVTGLSVIPDLGATLSVFGKIVLAMLIEVGGLGFITIALFLFKLLEQYLTF